MTQAVISSARTPACNSVRPTGASPMMIFLTKKQLQSLLNQAVEKHTMSVYADAIVSLSTAVTDLTVAVNAAVAKMGTPVADPDPGPIQAAVDQVKAATAALDAAVNPPVA